jgi:hypothetical protein
LKFLQTLDGKALLEDAPPATNVLARQLRWRVEGGPYGRSWPWMFGWIDLVEAGWRVALHDRHLHHRLCAFGSCALLTRHPRGIAEGLIFGGSAADVRDGEDLPSMADVRDDLVLEEARAPQLLLERTGASALADPAQESGATVALGQLSNRLAVEQLAARLVKS